jgi:hypothetical protein
MNDAKRDREKEMYRGIEHFVFDHWLNELLPLSFKPSSRTIPGVTGN